MDKDTRDILIELTVAIAFLLEATKTPNTFDYRVDSARKKAEACLEKCSEKLSEEAT